MRKRLRDITTNLPDAPLTECARLHAENPEFAKRYYQQIPWSKDTDYGQWCTTYLHAKNTELLDLPKHLDRTQWTDEDWTRHNRARDTLLQELSTKVRHNQGVSWNKKIKRARHRKILKAYRHQQRVEKKAERRVRKMERTRRREDHNAKVYEALEHGRDTTGKICKRTSLTTKDVRRTLRRLIKSGRATKSSARRYVLVKRQRRRLNK